MFGIKTLDKEGGGEKMKIAMLSRLRTIACTASLIAVIIGSPIRNAEALTIYSNDFQGVIGSEWSSTLTDIPPADATRQFLGRFADGTVSLSLSGLPSHTDISLEFDLYIMSSWDGDGPEGGTPDIWTANVSGGPVLLHTTFSNFPGRTQDYPGTYDDIPDGATNPVKAGAVEVNTLGYGGFSDFPGGDSVYHLSFLFPDTAGSVMFNFIGGPGLTSVADESWGLDNVIVSVGPDISSVPEPSTLLLLGSGLLGFVYFGRKRIRG